MNRKVPKILRFARRKSSVASRAIRKVLAAGVSVAFAISPAASGLFPAATEAKARPKPPQAQAGPVNPCTLHSAQGEIQHVIYIQFDNVHFTRDNPNVPSDLEQMPHLLHFLESNGTLLTNQHTPLISHTANDIVTSLTGVYPDRQGINVANSFGVFRPNGTATFASSFFYWTDLVNDVNSSAGDSNFGMLAADKKNAPAPWVPFTRAGCDFGAFAMANVIVERPSFDVPKIFGAGSTEAGEDFDHQTADFQGVGVHCALGSSLCTKAKAVADLLPDEPGGYDGFKALIGAKYLSAALGGPIKDLDGNVIVNSDSGLPGFTGFDPTASQSLGYIATMQEAGIPVTFAYIADAHDNHAKDVAFGPGEAGYVAQLASYDAAFDKFFKRLAADGITSNNTLFVITSDEGDHFAGGPPTPSTCDGVKTPCTYHKIGEVDANITDLLTKQDPGLTGKSFSIHFDMAPTFYLKGQPARGDATAREFERAAAKLTVVSPITGNTDHLTRYLADPVEMNLLHMVTADSQRTPTFVMFGNPDYFFLSFGTPDLLEDPGFAWNHGGVAPEINTTFLGLVGPGVKVKGVDDDVWSDHTDIRPTLLSLIGLKDDYQSQGRVLAEDLQDFALPAGVGGSDDQFVELASAYKRINAPVGELGLITLKISTAALAGSDDTYNDLEGRLQFITEVRDELAAKMLDRLTAAEFDGKTISQGEERSLVAQANALIDFANSVAAHL